ncbi:pseudouridine synthase [Nonlabens mediterrranea]|uniref:Pseudouridine synthase n=1 Tax=Nonlabens mediterrranea TaxID=1419947 RepID=A0ABS0A8G0_9FLAO|nr:pseudouridine synthase [Nonlabens mediterrranea]
MHRHFLIYKPYRMLSQFMTNDRHQKNKRFLGELYDFPENAMAVGRLDEHSEGLLLITTDGQLSHHINKSGKVNKEYAALVDGLITEQAIEQLQNGVTISINGSTYDTKPCQVQKPNQIPDLPETKQKIRDERHGPTSWVNVTLSEGKFRQVRKMTGVVGFPTLRLARVRIGPYNVLSLRNQQVIELSDQEIRSLFLYDNK